MSERLSTNSLLLPKTTAMALPGTALQKSNGSATGNPRNKCALKPGHSLMDWVRLGNSGADLAGTLGRVRPVSSEELSKHNTKEDAWLALRGKVFNVTRYMDFHPGGIDELMRGVGRDATKLFDEVHAWVNYQQLLSKCYIGPLLQNTVKIVENTNTKKADVGDGFAQPFAITTAPKITKIVPRLDWIQKRNEITFYIYTRQHCNPGLKLRYGQRSEKELQLNVQIGQDWHNFNLELQHSVIWPPKVAHIASETGKIEICLTKTEAALWSAYGSHTLTTQQLELQQDDEELQQQTDYVVASCVDFNHDSFELQLKAKSGDELLLMPVGYHVMLGLRLNGQLLQRHYTPIPAKYLQKPGESTNLNFLIKSYADGALSMPLRQLQVGAMVQVNATPSGNFKLEKLLRHRRLALLAAGSGLTPFLNLIGPLLQRNTNRIESLHLFYFNKTESDIWCRGVLDELHKTDERFTLTCILSQSTETWTGLKGHINKELCAPFANKNALEYATFVCICGPTGFSRKAEEILMELHFSADNLHIFQA